MKEPAHQQLTNLERIANVVAKRFGLSSADESDLRQEALIRLLKLRRDPGLSEVLPSSKYLKTTLERLAINLIRSRSRRPTAPLIQEVIADKREESSFADFDAETLVDLVRERLRRGGPGEYALDVITSAKPFPTAVVGRRRLARGILNLSPVAEGIVFQHFGFRRLQEFLDAVARVRTMAIKKVVTLPEPQDPRTEVIARARGFAERRTKEEYALARRRLPNRAAWLLRQFEQGKDAEKVVEDLIWFNRRPGRPGAQTSTEVERSTANEELWTLITQIREVFPTPDEEQRD